MNIIPKAAETYCNDENILFTDEWNFRKLSLTLKVLRFFIFKTEELFKEGNTDLVHNHIETESAFFRR